MVQAIGQLCEQLKKERIDLEASRRGRSPGGYGRARSTSNNRPAAAADFSKYDKQIAELKMSLVNVEGENDKLRNTMREMVDDYTRQLELRDDTIRRLESSQAPPVADGQVRMLRQEIEDYKQENSMQRGKIMGLTKELEMVQSNSGSNIALKNEIDSLNRQLMEKERFIDRQQADQKNEWAEIYGNQKEAFSKLEDENRQLKM